MSNNKDTILLHLKRLGLQADEAKIYIALLEKPMSHLEVSRLTGVNRTKVYRLADQLEKRSLVSAQTDDQGTLLVAADPSTLEVELVTQEEKLKNQRLVFEQVLPDLVNIKTVGTSSPTYFAVNTYEGVEGFKQMLWHELKAKGEILIFGSGTLEDLVTSKRWSEKHRIMSVKAGYTLRELLNPGKKKEYFTSNQEFVEKVYNKRYLPESTLNMDHQVVIYNNTVATFCWRNDQKVGFEVINKSYAQMMRQVFEHYWQLAK